MSSFDDYFDEQGLRRERCEEASSLDDDEDDERAEANAQYSWALEVQMEALRRSRFC
jgi:hypothetical protein